ncbi:hypothetical protein ACLB2K_061489 [Fragaria x ananassa]
MTKMDAAPSSITVLLVFGLLLSKYPSYMVKAAEGFSDLSVSRFEVVSNKAKRIHPPPPPRRGTRQIPRYMPRKPLPPPSPPPPLP